MALSGNNAGSAIVDNHHLPFRELGNLEQEHIVSVEVEIHRV